MRHHISRHQLNPNQRSLTHHRPILPQNAIQYILRNENWASKLEPTDVLSTVDIAAPAVATEDTTDCLTAAKILLVLFKDLIDDAAPWTIWLWTFKTDRLENDFAHVEHVTGPAATLLPVPGLPLFGVVFSRESRLECTINLWDVGVNSGFRFSELLWLLVGLTDCWCLCVTVLLWPNEEWDEFGVLGVRVTDVDDKDTEGMDWEETVGLPFTECALKLVCGDPGLGCV